MNPIQLSNPIPSKRNLIVRPLSRSGLFVVALTLAGITLSSHARAGCALGCDVSFNVFLGDNALGQNTTGFDNAAVGDKALAANTTGQLGVAVGGFALQSNTTGDRNTAVGGFSLNHNTTGSNNTATGLAALMMNTTGSTNTATGMSALNMNTTGHDNTADGAQALSNNTTGFFNTASGVNALFVNSTGSNNTASGVNALFNFSTGNNNTATGANALKGQFPGSGSNNTANGVRALLSNTVGIDNTASGVNALGSNSNGHYNTADGFSALLNNTSGAQNMATGVNALLANTTGGKNTGSGVNTLLNNTTGSSNTALGYSAGSALTSGSNNIVIGNVGVAAESDTIRIGTTQTAAYMSGISGKVIPAGVSVVVGANGKLGTVVSSKRFKEEIKPMDKASETILGLQPVTFRYKKELDPKSIPQFGLVAEEVEKINPDLVARDEHGKVYTVRYEAVNAMLLNEFLKEHRKGQQQDRKIEELEATVAKLQAAFKEQASQIQKVGEQLQLRTSAPQMVAINE